jgi:hypothetical protein
MSIPIAWTTSKKPNGGCRRFARRANDASTNADVDALAQMIPYAGWKWRNGDGIGCRDRRHRTTDSRRKQVVGSKEYNFYTIFYGKTVGLRKMLMPTD